MTIRTITADERRLTLMFKDGLAALDVVRDHVAANAEPSEDTERVIGALRRIEHCLAVAQLLVLEGKVKSSEEQAS